MRALPTSPTAACLLAGCCATKAKCFEIRGVVCVRLLGVTFEEREPDRASETKPVLVRRLVKDSCIRGFCSRRGLVVPSGMFSKIGRPECCPQTLWNLLASWRVKAHG